MIRNSVDVDELLYATHVKLQSVGQRTASHIVRIILRTPNEAVTYRKAYDQSRRSREQLSPMEASSTFIEASLSRSQYDEIRSKDRFFPCYTLLQRAKKQCYPDPQSYHITETSAEVNLQDLLNITVTRLVIYLKDVFESLSGNEFNLELVSKWGCDGSKQAHYKQTFSDSDSTDEHVFQSSFVPLRLSFREDRDKVVWQNPVPASPRYCRPIRIRFVKETIAVAKEEKNYIDLLISKLKETKIDEPKKITIKHTLLFTMIDGKVCNAITDTKSSSVCYICGASSKDFNNLSKSNQVNQNYLHFGLSSLHARIRFLEHLLHIAYKLPIKKWRTGTQQEKTVVQDQKTRIHTAFRQQLGLNIDVPKQGFGNTNDGNTSRRFFNDYEISSEITGIDKELMYRFKIILEAISSTFEIDSNKFSCYAMETAQLYVQLYSWYPMSPRIHKILIHGAIVIRTSILPIGQLSEEASEARNKHFRNYRKGFSRKFSRKACNCDVFNQLLLSSDPLITSNRKLRKKAKQKLSPEVSDMLMPSTQNNYINNSDSSDISIPSEDSNAEYML